MKHNLQAGRQPTGGINFSVLSAGDLDRIHAATLEVLWKSGVFVEDEEALEIFDGGGARVDPRTKIVKIPPHVLEDAVRSAPEMVVFAGRDPKHDLVLEKSRVHFDCFGEAIKIIDPNTGALRETTKTDLATTSRLVDALDNIDICHQYPRKGLGKGPAAA